MTKSKETIAEKIRKLLRVAACESATAAEKETALHQASRLSQKHAIDLDALGSEASDFGQTLLEAFGSRSPAWCLPVSMILNEHFNVCVFHIKHLSGRGGYDNHWKCFGCKPSREVAVYVWHFLKREFMRLCRQEMPVDRPSFYISVACGLSTALTEKMTQEEPEFVSGLIRIGDRTREEYASFSEGFLPVKVPTLTADVRAYQMGRKIQINPAIKSSDATLRLYAPAGCE
jgi:hypothetical protein